MKIWKTVILLSLAGLAWTVAYAAGPHQRGRAGDPGPGPGRGPGMFGGPGGRGDMQAIHALFANRSKIRRTVTEIPKGVETVTESEDPEVAALIRTHVEAMHRRLLEGRPIHARDPLFAQIFRNRKAIAMQIEPTDKGVKVTETSEDPYVRKLVRAHAAVVSRFLSEGHREMMRDHTPPEPDD